MSTYSKMKFLAEVVQKIPSAERERERGTQTDMSQTDP